MYRPRGKPLYRSLDFGQNVYRVKKFLIQVSALLIAIIVLAVIDFKNTINLNVGGTPSSSLSQVKINEALVNVEVADNAEKRAQGLGGRESLATDSGMLFVFQSPDKYTFWMKGMKISLDFIWITGDKVTDLLPNVPPPDPGVPDDNLLRYRPVVPIDRVLEVNAGFIAQHNIKIGDDVTYINK